MAEKATLPQANYVSDNPEQDWDRFQDVMKHILNIPKDAEDDTAVPKDLALQIA